MTVINVDYIFDKNKRLARLINNIGEILLFENQTFYEQTLIENFKEIKEMNQQEEKYFLDKLYHCILNKLKEIKFE